MDPEVIDELAGLLFFPSVFAVALLFTWLHHRNSQVHAQARAEVHKRFLEKFSSGQELSEFLDKEGSQRFLDEMWAERRHSTRHGFLNEMWTQRRQGARESLVGTIIGGVVVTSLSIGMFFLAAFVRDTFVIPAAILLSEAWGLVKEDGAGPLSPLQP